MRLNYHHLKYFQEIAHLGSVTKAAEKLRVAQSALSIQVKQLEAELGHPLFARQGRNLVLTETGRMALRYADTIFRTGDELVDALKHRPVKARQVLRIGSVSGVSRNFQWEFVKPFRNRKDVQLVLRSGPVRDLVMQLRNHELDVVLSNHALRRDAEAGHHSHLLAEQETSLVARPARVMTPFQFPGDCRTMPLLLPSLGSDIRAGFDQLLDREGIQPVIAAEADDMALLRVLALRTRAVALVPRVVVKDEIRTGALVERYRLAEVKERFYAITPDRTFPNPLLRELVARADL